MRSRLTTLRRNLSQSLGFVPGCIVALYTVLGVVLVEVDKRAPGEESPWIFQGDAQGARTVLSVISGSLITVAGLTFSITIVVLQLASSQFSPRILRTFFADRTTQVTIGTFVGIFVYALLVLRAVGSVGDAGFVPRLSVTAGALLAIVAVILLIVFLNHVARLIQVSHVAAELTHKTLGRLDVLYPERFGTAIPDADGPAALERWRTEPPGRLFAERPGFVQRVASEDLIRVLRGSGAERVVVLSRPGDLVALDTVLAEVWPAAAGERCTSAVREAIVLGPERDLHEDVAFGLRQLADIALRAISPGINDPATAVTCIGYLRSILTRLAERELPASVRRVDGLTVVVARRSLKEDLDVLLQISRYVDGDAWVAGELLQAAGACVRAARDAGAAERTQTALALVETIAERAIREAGSAADVTDLRRVTADIRAAV